MNAVMSKILTFLSGCTATIAAVGTGQNSGIPRWLTIACIVATGGFAKASIGMLPVTKS
jgi:hypothetical protein